jgi:outer membrane biosynthesis protein TonB
MAHLSITLLDYIAEKLDEEAKRLDVAHSTLIAHLKQVEKLIAEHEAEMQQVRDAYVEQVQQIKADSAARTQHVEEELQRLETLTRLQPPTAEPEPQPTAEPEPQPTAEPEPQPTVEPEPQPTAEPSPSVHPVSDTDVRSSRPRGGTLNVPTDVEPSPIEPSSKVAVTKDTDMRSMEETHRVIGKDDRIVLESGLFKSRAPREKQA